jgi:hypothetical protein
LNPPNQTPLKRAEIGSNRYCHNPALGPLVAVLALLALAACAGPGPGGETALIAPARPTVPVDNPFFCPHPPASLDTPTCVHP